MSFSAEALDDEPSAKTGPLVSPVLRAFRLLRYVVEGGSTSNLSEVGRSIDVNRVTVMRLIATLEHEGVLEALPQGGHRIGLAFLKLATAATAANDMLDLGRRVLSNVRGQLNVSAYLAALDAGHVVYLLRDMPEAGLVSSVKVGSRVAAHLTTPGRVLLAWQPRATLDALLTDEPLAAADAGKLERQLAADREHGCAWSFSGFEQGINSCAAPVFGGLGEAVAAISVAGPETAFGADQASRSRTERVVLQAARDLSLLLGCRDYPPAG
ncbi:IclR family transcriptional regulator [Pigmentiphaga sp. NML080357]|uniref:IclR family transcriptional regulator n=1 Tax=Pigmentiphaga sp. NML080357 TaxID=2008675 RepID=UPI000B41681E|nr:IclR family transcriptional regulator [Pigmentiphaga sp. NML080357]OVZ60666.1 IclR family transcriptional regulator [Pigmentiphaga sp. NML080357]